MPPDAGQFTMNSLFDTTALSGWSISPTPAPTTPADRQDDPDCPEPENDTTSDPTDDSKPSNGTNYYLDADRTLSRGWVARARDNLAAIRLSKELEASGRVPTSDEQHQLLRFVGFGASELAQNCFPLPGSPLFREGWEGPGNELMALATPEEYAALTVARQLYRDRYREAVGPELQPVRDQVGGEARTHPQPRRHHRTQPDRRTACLPERTI